MYLKTQGLVLREVAYKDTDKLLTVLTRDYGKMTLKARGVRRSGSPLKASCQLLACGEFTIFEYRGMSTINEAQTVELFPELRTDLELLSLGTYFAQVAEVLSQEDDPNPALLSLTLNALYALGKLRKPQGLVKAVFELRAACLAGYTPDLEGCRSCGNPEPDRSGRRLSGVRALPERRWDFCGRHTWHFGGDAPRRCLPGLQAVFLLPGGGDASGLWQPDRAVPLHPTGTGIFYFGFL